jgi:hypothetical protein
MAQIPEQREGLLWEVLGVLMLVFLMAVAFI